MIDLTKPIRRKDGSESKQWRVMGFDYHRTQCFLLISDSGDGCNISPEGLGRDYENIPGPRKPREWFVTIYTLAGGKTEVESGILFNDRRLVKESNVGRVIEWPRGAPLPEWPE